MPYFEYCTVKDLRDEGVTVAEANLNRLIALIRVSSSKINRFTSQWYIPVETELFIDGKNSALASLPNCVPIQKIEEIEVISERSTRKNASVLPDRRTFGPLVLADVSLSNNGRYIELVSLETGSLIDEIIRPAGELWFPEGRRNIRVKGVFGWVEDQKEVSTTAAVAANKGDARVQLTDISGWEEGDFALFELAAGTRGQMVTNIDESTSELVFGGDTRRLLFAVPQDTVVKSFGRTPVLIRRAAVRLTAKEITLLGAEDSASQMEELIQRAIVSERTDNYSYRLDPTLLREATESNSGTTGDPQVDSILQEFVEDSPPYVGFA